ncbi:MAG TPA: copper homeostasis periplasmic binding protein CopC [Stellaceae bacterium]|nr:copper homeostasis periplasmic binding protein CopC [Stellaceae bacterium]
MRKPLLVLLFGLLVGLVSRDAEAHAQLRASDPAVGSTVSASPAQIRLVFSEGIEPKFSGVAITDADGKTVDAAPLALDPADRKQVVVALPSPLAPGTYKVAWHVVSVDTHKTQGAFTFTIKP